MKKTVSKIIDELGRDALAKSLSLKTSQITNAIAANVFPCPWFLGIESLCIKSGIERPDALFKMRGPK